MSSCGSITNLLHEVRAGDQAAIRALYKLYYPKVVELAGKRLRGKPPSLADEEDIAQEALVSFFRGAAAGKFARLNSRSDLWQLLGVLTTRKAVNLIRHEACQIRDREKTVSTTEFLDQLESREPPADIDVPFNEYFQHLLDLLPKDDMREVVLLKLSGYPNAEIAGELQIALRSVERKLHLIRSIWSREIES